MTLRTRIGVIFGCAVLAIGSAVAVAFDLVLARSFGDCLTKPLRPDELARVVNALKPAA